MHPWVLRELADVAALLLSIIFKHGRMGDMPDEERKDNVTPRFKKGKKENVGNSRGR